MGRSPFTFAWIIFISTLVLVILGLATLLSIDHAYFTSQILFSLIGVGLFFVFLRVNFYLYSYFDLLMYAAIILFLLMSFLGPEVRGATRWLEIADIRIQPSELIKPFYILVLSSFLTKYPPTIVKNLLRHMLLLFPPLFLIFKQPDLGNVLVLLIVWIGLLILSGLQLRMVFLGGLGIFALLPIVSKFLHDYQKLRILTFLNPELDPQGAGYNALQSTIAVGSGQLFGRGFGRGPQSLLQFLPERHTDFIFASFAEEFGLVGGLILIGVFFILLWQILKHARVLTQHTVARLYINGFFLTIFTHVVINIGMNMGIVPVTGITLPFVSYGGSSLLSLWIGLGILFTAFQAA